MFHTSGVILKKSHYREFDEIFTVYTKDFGKIEAIGRGVKKPTAKLANHLQIFDFSDIEFVLGKNFKVLTGAIANKNLLCSSAADFFGLLDSLTPIDDPDENIWDLILRYIALNYKTNPVIASASASWRRSVAISENNNIDCFVPRNDGENCEFDTIFDYFQFQLLSLGGFSPNILSFNAKLPSTEKFLKLFSKSDEKAIVGLRISKEESDDIKNAMNYFKNIAFGYLR